MMEGFVGEHFRWTRDHCHRPGLSGGTGSKGLAAPIVASNVHPKILLKCLASHRVQALCGFFIFGRQSICRPVVKAPNYLLAGGALSVPAS